MCRRLLLAESLQRDSFQLLDFPLTVAGRSQNDLGKLLLQDESLILSSVGIAQALPGLVVGRGEDIQFVRGKVRRILSEGHWCKTPNLIVLT